MLYIYIIIEQLINLRKNEFFLESILTRFYFLLLLRTLTVENELCGTSELGIWLREWKTKVLQFILFRHNRLTSLKRTIFQTCTKMNEKNEKKIIEKIKFFAFGDFETSELSFESFLYLQVRDESKINKSIPWGSFLKLLTFRIVLRLLKIFTCVDFLGELNRLVCCGGSLLSTGCSIWPIRGSDLTGFWLLHGRARLEVLKIIWLFLFPTRSLVFRKEAYYWSNTVKALHRLRINRD